MANVIIALATLAIGFILATYGAYNSYHSAKRTEYATRVTASFNRLSGYIGLTMEDLGRRPTAAEVVASRFTDESGNGLTYTYGATGSHFWVCARAARSDWMIEAFEKVQNSRQGVVIGDACDSATGAGASNVSVTMRIS
jgi:hypothetical protein